MFTPRGTVSVSSLGYFSSVGSSSKLSHPSLPLFLGAHHIQEYFNKKRVRKRKFIKPQENKSSVEEHCCLGGNIISGLDNGASAGLI